MATTLLLVGCHVLPQKRNWRMNYCLVFFPTFLSILLVSIQVAINNLLGDDFKCGCEEQPNPTPGGKPVQVCGVQFSNDDQKPFCGIDNPTPWPAILQVPGPEYRATDLPDLPQNSSCRATASCATTILYTGTNKTTADTLASLLLGSGGNNISIDDPLYSLASVVTGEDENENPVCRKKAVAALNKLAKVVVNDLLVKERQERLFDELQWPDEKRQIRSIRLHNILKVHTFKDEVDGRHKTYNTESVLQNLEARRRLEFFTNSLFMHMPAAKPVSKMFSFCSALVQKFLRQLLLTLHMHLNLPSFVSTQFSIGRRSATCPRSLNPHINGVLGKGFCKAAEKATKLVASNASTVSDVIMIGDLILFLGKLCVSFGCALFAFLILDTHRYKSSQDRVSSPLFPVLFCWGFVFVTASIFFAVGEMALDTVLVSYCIDADENKGTALFTPAALVEGLNAFTERQEALEQARLFRKYRTYKDNPCDHDHKRGGDDTENREKRDTNDDDSS